MSIVLSNISKRFGSDLAVDGVTLDIEQGEFFVVLGPSGCGKTTLLRLIAGLEAPDSGEIRLGDHVVASDRLHIAPEQRNVGVVFQSYALWPHMTVRDNVAFPLQTAGAAKNTARGQTEQYLAMVELTRFADRMPAALSGGQRQRVALARCLAQGAETILMDEPLANLDPHLRGAMEEELALFHRSARKTTLYITHDQREAMALADRVAIMWGGHILQADKPETIYDQPIDERVARFIGQGAVLDADVLKTAKGRAQAHAGAIALDIDCPANTKTGMTRIVIRPKDLMLADGPDSLDATIDHIAYRGGFWEARIRIPGIEELLVINLPGKAAIGETVRVKITNGWALQTDARAFPRHPGSF